MNDPTSPTSGLQVLRAHADAERLAVLHCNGKGLLPLDGLPFEEAAEWKDATAPTIGVAEGRECGCSFALRVDRLAPTVWVLASIWNEAPQ
jgi:hypothetical protein